VAPFSTGVHLHFASRLYSRRVQQQRVFWCCRRDAVKRCSGWSSSTGMLGRRSTLAPLVAGEHVHLMGTCVPHLYGVFDQDGVSVVFQVRMRAGRSDPPSIVWVPPRPCHLDTGHDLVKDRLHSPWCSTELSPPRSAHTSTT
jgi:hypothetical protein